MKYFDTLFLAEAEEYLATLNPKIINKVLYNIDRAELTNDPKLFKKLHDEIWEFRTKYLGWQIRFLAFWDKSKSSSTLVIVSNGFTKKSRKTPSNEINKAIEIRRTYFSKK